MLTRLLGATIEAERPVRPSALRARQRRLTADELEVVAGAYRAGSSMNDLANSFQVHRTTIAGHLRRLNVPLRRQGLPDEQLAEAVSLYGVGWSCQRLAERYHCCDETVRQTLRRAGVNLRSPWERRDSRDPDRRRE